MAFKNITGTTKIICMGTKIHQSREAGPQVPAAGLGHRVFSVSEPANGRKYKLRVVEKGQ